MCRSPVIVALLALAQTASSLVIPALSPSRASGRARQARACADAPLTVEHFLRDLEFLGPCRFVVVGPGAILEAVGAFEDMRVDEAKGLATVSTETGFECHVRLSQVEKATFVAKESADKTLHIVRLIGSEGKSLLSAILSPEEPGEEIESGAIEYWSKLKERFGEEVQLAQS